MAKPRITLIGLGETGMSIGLALLKEPGEFEVVGHDRDTAVEAEARRNGAVHRTEWNLHTAVAGASLVIIAAPLKAIVDTFGHIPDDLAPEALVFAVNGLLQPVSEAAARLLPGHKRIVAGHPILLRPPAAPSAATFHEATFCIAAPAHAEPAAVELASDLVDRIGATPHFVDALEHDGIMAAVDQLPALLSAMLITQNTASTGWREARQLAGRRFVQTSSLLGNPAEAAAAFALNRDALLPRLAELQRSLDEWRALIENADLPAIDAPAESAPGKSAPPAPSPLLDALMQAAKEQEKWAEQAATQRWDETAAAPEGSSGGLFRQLFLGNLGRKKVDDRTSRS
jgi:prephenate dehydrogenase